MTTAILHYINNSRMADWQIN